MIWMTVTLIVRMAMKLNRWMVNYCGQYIKLNTKIRYKIMEPILYTKWVRQRRFEGEGEHREKLLIVYVVKADEWWVNKKQQKTKPEFAHLVWLIILYYYHRAVKLINLIAFSCKLKASITLQSSILNLHYYV